MKETSITIGETKVQGWVPDTQGGQPEYCIFYGVSDAGTVGFYRYDLTDKTIQRYFEQSSEGNSQSLELQDLAEKYNALVDDYNIARIALVAVAAVAVILLILLIISRIGRNRRMEETDDMDYDQLDEPAEKKQKKESKKNGRRLSKEERYMMGEEDDYEENSDFRDNESEDPDAEEYLPEAADDADAQLDEMKKQLAASVTEKSEHGTEKHGEEPVAGADPESDDFEVFDLDDDL